MHLSSAVRWAIQYLCLFMISTFTVAAMADFEIVETKIDGQGFWHNQIIFYPKADQIQSPRPIVVISHGNGHRYTYYKYLQTHLAKKGFITMSHTNNTGPGIESASTTTLENTEIFLAELDTLDGGVLKGLYDSKKIAWIGHSRGGEGVVRAYTRLLNKDFVPKNYTSENIQFISSIAPTTFLKAEKVNPEDVNYHMFVGAADGDVNGRPNRIVMSMPIYERAWGERQLTYVHGAGHNVFNDQSWDEGRGPKRLDRETVHEVSKSYYEILLNIYLNGDTQAMAMISNHNTLGRPQNIPSEVVIANEYRAHRMASKLFIVDDFQKEVELTKASHGAVVSSNLNNMTESTLQDGNSSFSSLDSLNGLTRYIDQVEPPIGAVFDWQGADYFLKYTLPQATNIEGLNALSFRAAQISRDPLNKLIAGSIHFSVVLIDGQGQKAEMSTQDFGEITYPYAREGGWAAEFNTIRLPLDDFLKINPNLDLKSVEKVHFQFGSNHGSESGRIALDDIEFQI
ncbi:MAG: hypothetical protein AAF203_05505 [Pseudomonadota bacterium]